MALIWSSVALLISAYSLLRSVDAGEPGASDGPAVMGSLRAASGESGLCSCSARYSRGLYVMS
jgi:hypothetical protein